MSRQVTSPLDAVDHVDILLLVGVAMEDDFLHLDVVVQGDLEVGIVVVILVEEDPGMEGVIRTVPDQEVEVLIGILGENEGGGEGVRVIVVILVEVRLLLHVGGVELGVEAPLLEGGGIEV
jgi:hypothetical protein